MKTTPVEDDVRRMLRRRAADVPDDLTAPTPESRGAVGSTGVGSNHVVGLTDFSARARHRLRPARLIAAAAFVVTVPLAALAVTRAIQDDDGQVRAGPLIVETPSVPTPSADLTLVVYLQQDLSLTAGSPVTLSITDVDGALVGEPHLGAPLKVLDPGAEPGSVGSDLTTNFGEVSIPQGRYRVRVQVTACATSGCDSTGPDTEFSCDSDLNVEAPGTAAFLRIKADADRGYMCDGPGPFTQEQEDAANALLDRQIASGWVPYNGDEVIPGYPTPADAWVPATFGGMPGCERPPTLGPDVQFTCVFDAAAGNVIGYSISNLGFVPKDLIGSIDIDGKFVERFGCNPQEDHLCVPRWLAGQYRAELARPDLSDEDRQRIESDLAEIERSLGLP